MPGRTSDIHTSSFKPLDLNEIMMIPLAKQKMHDEILAGTDKFGMLTSDVLSPDEKQAKKAIDGFKSRADQLSTDVTENGVSRSQFQALRGLRNEANTEMSSGFTGRAMANKKSASEYMQALATDKERQAGWSPQEAKQWAQSEVSKFQGTANADGTFNHFSGKELSTRVDETKFIAEAVESVSEHLTAQAMRVVKMGNIPAFQVALQDGTIKKVEFNRIMEAILTKSKNDPQLLKHLEQQAFFTGEKNPLDMGKMNYTKEFVLDLKGNKVLDKEGNPKTRTLRDFEMGTSRYGRKIAGAGLAGEYSNITVNTKFLKNDLAYDMYKNNLDEKDALELIDFQRGEANQITADSIEKTRETNELYGEQARAIKVKADARRDKLIADGASEEDIKNDVEYQRLNNNYIDHKVIYKNSKNRIDHVYRKVDSKLSKDDKAIFNVKEVITKHGGNWVKALKAEYDAFPDPKKNPRMDKKKYGPYADSEEQVAYKMFMERAGVDMSKGTRSRGDFISWGNIIHGANERRDGFTEEYLKRNPQAEYFTRFNAESTGKFATQVGRYNDLKTEHFSVPGANLAYNQGLLEEHEDYTDIMVEGEKPQLKVEITDGSDDSGDSFDNLIVTTSKGSSSFQVVDTGNGSARRSIAKQLLKGDYAQRKMGNQMLADLLFMKNVKRSGIAAGQDKGVFRVDIAGEVFEANYIKDEPSGAYQVFIEGRSVGDRFLYGAKEVSAALYEESKEIEIEIEKSRKK